MSRDFFGEAGVRENDSHTEDRMMNQGEPPFSLKSPIPNARRIVTYDDRGEPIHIEWELIDAPTGVAGKVIPMERKGNGSENREEKAA